MVARAQCGSDIRAIGFHFQTAREMRGGDIGWRGGNGGYTAHADSPSSILK
jgi:hypothetical protein